MKATVLCQAEPPAELPLHSPEPEPIAELEQAAVQGLVSLMGPVPKPRTKRKTSKEATEKISVYCLELGLSTTLEESAHALLSTLLELNATKRKPAPAIAGACIFNACRHAQQPVPLKTIAAVCKINLKELSRSCYVVSKALQSDVVLPPQELTFCYCQQLVRALELPEDPA